MSLSVLDLSGLKFQEGQQPEILIESYSDAVRTIQIRGFTQWGTFSFDHVTLGTRGIKSEAFRIPGIPIGLTATSASTSISRGRMYVRLKLRLAGFPVLDLTAAYLTDTKELAWPPGIFESSLEGRGFIRTLSGTDPASNTQISETTPTGAYWKLLSFGATLTTSSQAATRQAAFVLDNGTTTVDDYYAPITQIASLANNYFIMAGLGFEYAAVRGSRRNVLTGIRLEIAQPAAYRIRSTVDSMQNLDDWGGPIYIVEEYINP